MGGVTHRDVVFVKVVDNPAPPVLGTLSIDPVPPDSAKRSAFFPDLSPTNLFNTAGAFGVSLLSPASGTDTAGQPMTNIGVAFGVSDSTVAAFVGFLPYDDALGNGFRASFVPKYSGSVNFYASATAFGVTKVDTLPYRIGWPLVGSFWMRPEPSLGVGNFFGGGGAGGTTSEITVGTGAFVGWFSSGFIDGTPSLYESDIVFDDPTNVAPLNTAAAILRPGTTPGRYPGVCTAPKTLDGCSTGGNFTLPANTVLAAYRVFPVPGTYEVQNAQNGARARIVVVDE